MAGHSLKAKLRYRFDNTMSKGTPAMIAWLGLVSLALILGISSIVALTVDVPDDPGFVKIAWMSLMRTLDSGTMGGDEGGWPFLISMLLVTLGGIFIISTLIGVLTTGIEAQLDRLRKGRSTVIEDDHTVILGWSEAIFSIVTELSIANESRKGKGAGVVILADKDKVEMEDEVRERCDIRKGTRVVCRTGMPTEFADLEITSLHDARSIIVLSPEIDDPDPEVVKTLLAIVNNPGRRAEPYHIVAQIQHAENFEVASTISPGEVTILQTEDLVARIVAQTCLLSGLSVVYSELLTFDGDEMYFFDDPALVGKTFGEALFLFETSCVMGIAPHDAKAFLNPPMDTVIRDGDKLVMLAEDDDKIEIAKASDMGIKTSVFMEPAEAERITRDILILGWNERGPLVINQLDTYMIPGSTIDVIAADEQAASAVETECAGAENAKVSVTVGDTTQRAVLDRSDIAHYEHIIVLADGQFDAGTADTRILFTLLHLRDIAGRHGKSFSIVSEVSDVRNLRLAQAARADDFVVSNRLISMLMTQISENKGIKAVYDDILDADGSEIYLKPVERYVKPGEPVNFHTVVASAQRYNEVAFGYRHMADAADPTKAFGVKLNPAKTDSVTFAPGDRIIVAAED